MLSSLRKKTEAVAPANPAWHPNFRNYERLPDTKVVRTAFFINGGAILLALFVLGFFAWREFQRHDLGEQVASWNMQIEADRAASEQAVKDYARFQAEEKKIKEVAAHLAGPFRHSEFIRRLAALLPPEIVIDYFDSREAGVTLRGSVRGTPGEASGTASAFVARLQEDEEVGRHFESIALTSINRSASTGRLNLEVFMKAPTTAKKKKKR